MIFDNWTLGPGRTTARKSFISSDQRTKISVHTRPSGHEGDTELNNSGGKTKPQP
jgi:hypothetical protein